MANSESVLEKISFNWRIEYSEFQKIGRVENSVRHSDYQLNNEKPQNRHRTGFNEGSSGRNQREFSESRQLLHCRIFKLTPQLKPVMRVKYYFDRLGTVAFHKLVFKVKQNYYLLSQAAACDGTTVTTSAIGQEITPGTLPTF